jgi:hypothetical protein
MNSRARIAAVVMTAALLCALGAVSLPGRSRADSVGSVQSSLAGSRAQERALSISVGNLSRVIAQLSSSIALVEGRESTVEAALANDRAQLASVTAQLTAQRTLAQSSAQRFARAQRVLREQLLSTFETDQPDTVSIVLSSNGFADLLDQLEFLKDAREQQKAIIVDARHARDDARAAAVTLARLQTRVDAVTTATAAQAQALVGMNALLSSRQSALETARAAQSLALSSARSRSGRLAKELHKLESAESGVSLSYGNWAIPAAIVMCESGGQDLPPNSAGASGFYQFMPATWKGLGGDTPAAYLAPKAEQDRLAAKLWDGGRGASNWVCASIVGII